MIRPFRQTTFLLLVSLNILFSVPLKGQTGEGEEKTAKESPDTNRKNKGPKLSRAEIHYNLSPYPLEYRKPNSIFYCDTTFNKKRAWTFGGLAIGTYTAAFTALGVAWYSTAPKSKFHWFNDLHEWKQVDKMGHMMGGYQGSRAAIQILKWAGVNKTQTLLIGGLTGFVMLSPVEILDGFSAAYGASATDLIANGLGSGIAVLNEALWNEQRMQVKISFHPTGWAKFRPDLLGDKVSQVVKDYNGHTHWLSLRVYPFLPEGKFKEHYPKWLNVAVGYGAEGLLGGYEDPNGSWKTREFRQYYLSFDVDLSMIKTGIGTIDWLLSTLNFIHLPTPAIEFSKKGVRFFPFFM